MAKSGFIDRYIRGISWICRDNGVYIVQDCVCEGYRTDDWIGLSDLEDEIPDRRAAAVEEGSASCMNEILEELSITLIELKVWQWRRRR